MNFQRDNEQPVFIIGIKESFLIKALRKKISDSGMESEFVKCEVNAINPILDKAKIIAFYLDNTEHVKTDVLHFVAEHLMDTGIQVALIGERTDTDEAKKYIPLTHILGVFGRPLDTDAFIKAVREQMANLATISSRNSILIVDDDATYMGVIRGWLKDIYNVAMANSGAQAIRYLSINKVDLILLDFEMPVLSGPQVLQMLRSEPDSAKIPVIFLTGRNDRESVMKVVALKPEGYLLKTIQKADLIKELKAFFDAREK